MKLLGLDFETTGLSFEDDRIIEIGAVLWDSETGKPLQIFSHLVKHEDSPELTSEITEITGITQEMIDTYGVGASKVFPALATFFKKADAVVAHNGREFDRPMLEAHLSRTGGNMPALPWIDTMLDVPYSEKITTRKLSHLAADHGFLNPFAHRAIFDVMTMLMVLQKYNVEEVFQLSQEPDVTLIAQVSFEEKDLAKNRHYKWHAETRTWRKTLKESKVPAEQQECGFATRVLSIQQ